MSASPRRRSTEDETIEAMAAAWLAQRDEGLTDEEAQEFARWRAADPRREAVVARLERAWATMQRLRDFRPGAQAHPDRDLLTRRRRHAPLRFLFPGVVAGVAAALVLAVFWYNRTPDTAGPAPSAQAAKTYTAVAGGFQRVTLSDGSVMDLNGGSEVRVAYAAAERRVTLLRGEAHFTVAKNPARPFWVEAGSMTVRAVGTAFNVRLETATVEVLVTEGKVEVDDTRVSAVAAAEFVENLASRVRAVLDAGDRISVPIAQPPGGVRIPVVEKLAPEAVRAELAWQDSWLVFSDTPLAEVVARFNARNRVQLLLGDAELEQLPIGGTFRVENIEAFVRLLAAGNHIEVERPTTDRIVLRRGR